MATTRSEPPMSEPAERDSIPQNSPKFPIRENGEHVKEDSSPPLNPASRQLTEQQLIAITIMVAGRTLADVAKGAGVDRKTLYNWRHYHAAFRAELQRRRSDVWDETADRIRALLEPSVRMLEDQIRSRYDQDRYRAARTILRLARVGSNIAVKQRDVEGGEEA